MFFKRHKRGLALYIAATIFFSTLPAYVSPFACNAASVSELKKNILAKQKEIEEANKTKKQLQSGLSDVKNIISGLEKSKNDLATYVTTLDKNLTEIQNKITELSNLITEKENEIAKTKLELEAAIADEENQYNEMMARIKAMYERGDSFYFEAIFAANSFGDMLNRADYIEQLSAYDKMVFEKFQATREYVEICKAQLESEQELLEEAKVEVEKEQASLKALIAEKEREIEAYENDISNREKLAKEYEAEIAAQTAEIKELEKAAKAMEAELAKANKPKQTYDGGMFAWPAPSYTRISDDYGNRMHPTLHIQRFHSGIDMAAPGGSPILAAYKGVVVSAAYSSTMGNYVMIDHGNNLYTVYMHASALYVSSGQSVTKGQKIAAVGTTGRSTGNHLHFGVRLNGSYVNPWNYLSK